MPELVFGTKKKYTHKTTDLQRLVLEKEDLGITGLFCYRWQSLQHLTELWLSSEFPLLCCLQNEEQHLIAKNIPTGSPTEEQDPKVFLVLQVKQVLNYGGKKPYRSFP